MSTINTLSASPSKTRTVSKNVDWIAWGQERCALGQDSQSEYVGSNEKLHLAVSYLALEIAHRPNHDWKTEAMDAEVLIPKSKHPCMPATAATFGRNKIEKKRHDLAKFLDRTALAVEYLTAVVRANPTQYPPSSDGVMALDTVISQESGLTAIAAKQRKENTEKKKPKKQREPQIALDSEKHRQRALSLAREKVFSDNPAGDVCLAFIDNVGQTPLVRATVPVNTAQMDALLLSIDVAGPLIRQFGELLEAGQMVFEEASDELKDPLDDPENPDQGYRVQHRHFILEDGKPITISPILSGASVVVLAKPLQDFVPTLSRRCHLRTRERRILEANIAEPTRRSAFQAKWGEVGDVNGVCRLVVSTDIAVNEKDNGRNVGCLIEPLQSAQDNLPLEVLPDRFKPQFEGAISIETWRSRNAEALAKPTRGATGSGNDRQDHQFSTDFWKIELGKKVDERGITGSGTTVLIPLMRDDFARVSATIAGLPVSGNIKIAADRNVGLRFQFKTTCFDFQVYIPLRTPAGDRNPSLFRPFSSSE